MATLEEVNAFALKSIQELSNPTNNILAATTFNNLAVASVLTNDLTSAFGFETNAIYYYLNSKDMGSFSLLPKQTVLRIYVAARQLANKIGRTNEENQFNEQINEMLSPSTNSSNAHP